MICEYCSNLHTETYGSGRFCTKKCASGFEEQNYHCNRCNISHWLESLIKLELEHKDGNKNNNSRNNLEGLCPNCHSFTPTWRKSKSAKSRVCDEIGKHLSLRN